MPSFKYVLEYLFEGEVIKTQEVDELYSGSAELTVTNINIMLDWEGH